VKVACFGYRDWATKIFNNLKATKQFTFTDVNEADVVLFYGWSSMIPPETYLNKLCLILHPSPLPKYRGGSPLQHQIINGEKMSAVTIFKATGEMDAGPIYSQVPLSLEGSLDEIFDRIIDIGTKETIRILANIDYNQARPWSQDESKATLYKRRKPEESEIDLSKPAEELYNFIRALTTPYPNAFIRCSDGKKLYITGVHLESPEELIKVP